MDASGPGGMPSLGSLPHRSPAHPLEPSIETRHRIEGLASVLHPRKNGLECGPTLCETSGERLIGLNQNLSGSYYVADPAAPPPGVLIEATDLLYFLCSSPFGYLEPTCWIPAQLAQASFLARGRSRNDPPIEFELGLSKKQVEGT